MSVVVCSYNGSKTLDGCLKSLETLNYPDYEVVLVNDGSTDSVPEIAARYPYIRYHAQPNRGLSVARNVGPRSSSAVRPTSCKSAAASTRSARRRG